MEPNMGTADRVIRIVVAAVIAAFYFGGVIEGTVGIVLLLVAAIFALTGFVSFCPLYAPFKLSTLKKSDKQ